MRSVAALGSLRSEGAMAPLSQFEVADVAHVVAVPQITIMDGYAMDERIFLCQLDLFDDFSCLHIVPEKCPPIRVGDPECIALPTDAVGAVTGGLPHRL